MPAEPITLPSLPTTPPLPPVGIHFGLPFEQYLAAPACGSGSLKEALADPLLFWARSWMNPDKVAEDEEEAVKEKAHNLYGRAFHCRLLEGSDEFDARFYVEPDKADFKDLIETDADLRAAIAEFEEKPVSGNKPARIAQLLELWPEAPIWDHICEQARREAGDRQAIKAEWAKKFELSAAAVENNPELLPLVAEGYAEVSLFWHCPLTGIPKKARVDRLHLGGMVDVKTLANSQERSLRRAIPREIADRKYPLQASHYLEGAQVVRDLVRRMGADAVHHFGETFTDAEKAENGQRFDFARAWSQHEEPDWWTWLFVQKGDAPTVLGTAYQVDGIIREQFDMLCAEASERIAEFAIEFGAKPWAQHFEVWQLEDNMIPAWALEV